MHHSRACRSVPALKGTVLQKVWEKNKTNGIFFKHADKILPFRRTNSFWLVPALCKGFFSNLKRCVLRRKLVLLLGSRGASHFYKVFGSDPNNPSVIWDCQILSPYSGHSLREKGNGNINLWISELQPCFGSWLLAYFVTSKAILWKTSSLFILVKCFHNPKGRKVAASVMGCKTALISEKRRNTVKQSTPLHLTWHLDLVLMCSFLLLFYSSYQLLTYPKMLLFSKQSLQLKIMKHHV